MNTDLRISLLLAAISFSAGFLIVPYQLQLMPEVREMLTISVPVATLLSSVQLFILSFILAFAGCKLARRAELPLPFFRSLVSRKAFQFDQRGVVRAVVAGLLTAFLIIASDRFYFADHIPHLQSNPPEFSVLALLAGVLYGGFVEEVMLRLFLMSAFVVILAILFKKKPATLYWTAIILASLVFAAGHLPATITLFGGLTPLIIFRSFLLNGIGGLFFGYLFWKHGFIYAVIAHMLTHIFMQLVFIPAFY
ncbi:CPBP family intramembrane glutamic endopeptidase [Salimicrobium sp. PL1-032A]|uniref:CPBP family intramembrane glutamic endopeptidase n=1 Tax=Salimicrobium sp. PL1-032A TaxID=3095364 RepID=UPI003260586A